ncbi:MAG: hypothetical protein GVY26_19935 [Bacteroidetes bacterium]|jgi:hypothetical protein|nr:hypothetical protein [Bacteroidota bacterium]
MDKSTNIRAASWQNRPLKSAARPGGFIGRKADIVYNTVRSAFEYRIFETW